MNRASRQPLEYYLALDYPMQLIPDEDLGGYTVVFPDLPGCLTQIDTLDELSSMAEEARTLWIETAYEDGHDIPLPSATEEYSGKFNVRLPRSLHRELAEESEREGVSLNTYVATLLARRDAQARVEQQLLRLQRQIGRMAATMERRVRGMPNGARAPYVMADMTHNNRHATAA